MLRHRGFLSLFLIAGILFMGCLPSVTKEIPTIEIFTPIVMTIAPTLSPLGPKATFTPTRPALTNTTLPEKPIATHRPALPPENILKYRPLEIASRLPEDVNSTNILVLSGEGEPYQLILDPQTRIETLTNVESYCLSSSPDGRWLAYCAFSEESPTGLWLIAESSDHRQKKKTAIDMQLRQFGAHLWLDNQSLIFTLIRDQVELHPMVVVNPFTGKQQELASEYPGLQLSVAGPAGHMQFGISNVVYDPSLDLVLYQEDSGARIYIVLWDRKAETVLAKIEDLATSAHYPIWSPNSRQVAIAVFNHYEEQSDKFIDEWFLVSREGQIERLTHFGEYFEKAYIGAASWSPDSQRLAFWLEVEPSPCPGGQLAIMDTQTREVVDLCVPGSVVNDPPPLWSLDGRLIATRSSVNNTGYAILVDVEQGWAAQIAEHTHPAGWLVGDE